MEFVNHPESVNHKYFHTIEGNVVRIQPPLVISDAALDRALDVVDEALGAASRDV